MSQSNRTKRRTISGVVGVGIGALLGAFLGIPFLEKKNAVGFLGPLLGAIIGGLVHRLIVREKPVDSGEPTEPKTPAPPGNSVDNKTTVCEQSVGPSWGAAIAFLILGPVIAGCICYFLLGEPLGTDYSIGVLTLGIFVGIVGFIACLFVES
jgi:hypothetical protein